MAANINPIFAKTPKVAVANVTAANTALDGTGTMVTLVTAGLEGCIITSLVAMTRAALAAATTIRLFVSVDAGVTKMLLDEKVLAAFTPAAGSAQTPVKFVDKEIPEQAIRLPASAILYAAAHDAGNFAVVAEFGDY